MWNWLPCRHVKCRKARKSSPILPAVRHSASCPSARPSARPAGRRGVQVVQALHTSTACLREGERPPFGDLPLAPPGGRAGRTCPLARRPPMASRLPAAGVVSRRKLNKVCLVYAEAKSLPSWSFPLRPPAPSIDPCACVETCALRVSRRMSAAAVFEARQMNHSWAREWNRPPRGASYSVKAAYMTFSSIAHSTGPIVLLRDFCGLLDGSRPGAWFIGPRFD